MADINRGIKILIVDDSRSMRRIVTGFFTKNGFENLCEASDGVRALEMIESEPVDLIVSDLNMPAMNGLELLEAVKGNRRTRSIPFIMLTVEAIQKTMNQALALEVDSYIVKPIEENVFIDEVIRVIKNSKGKEQLT